MVCRYPQACPTVRLPRARACSSGHVYARNQDGLLEVLGSVRGFVVETRGGDILSAWLREREHPDDVDDLLRSHPTGQPNGSTVLAVMGTLGSPRYVV